MNLIACGVNLGQFYGLYALKQFLSIQTEPYKLVNFNTPAYGERMLPEVPKLEALPYMTANWPDGRRWLTTHVTGQYDKLLFFFAPLTKGLTGRHIETYRAGTFHNPDKGKSFVSAYKEYKKLLFAIDCGLSCDHYINDPCEPDLSRFDIKELCFYAIPGRAEYSDYIEREIARQPGPENKTRRFTFGFSNVSNLPHRTQLYHDLEMLGIPFFYKGVERDNMVGVEEYNHLIAQSYYTLIVPAYDTEHFSWIRYLEAEHRGCTPLIHPDCNLEYVRDRININFLLKDLAHLREFV